MARYRTWLTAFVTFLLLSGLAFAFADLNRYTLGGVIRIGTVMGMVVLGLVLLAIDARRGWALDAATRICLT